MQTQSVTGCRQQGELCRDLSVFDYESLRGEEEIWELHWDENSFTRSRYVHLVYKSTCGSALLNVDPVI